MKKKDPTFNTAQLGNLLARYKDRFKPPQNTVIKEVVVVVSEVLGYTITNAQVKYTVSTRTLSLQVPSILKTEIKRSEKELLLELKKRLGEHSAPLVIL